MDGISARHQGVDQGLGSADLPQPAPEAAGVKEAEDTESKLLKGKQASGSECPSVAIEKRGVCKSYDQDFANACSCPAHEKIQSRVLWLKEGKVQPSGGHEGNSFLKIAIMAENVPFVQELTRHGANLIEPDQKGVPAILEFFEEWQEHKGLVEEALKLAGRQLYESGVDLQSWLNGPYKAGVDRKSCLGQLSFLNAVEVISTAFEGAQRNEMLRKNLDTLLDKASADLLKGDVDDAGDSRGKSPAFAELQKEIQELQSFLEKKGPFAVVSEIPEDIKALYKCQAELEANIDFLETEKGYNPSLDKDLKDYGNLKEDIAKAQSSIEKLKEKIAGAIQKNFVLKNEYTQLDKVKSSIFSLNKEISTYKEKLHELTLSYKGDKENMELAVEGWAAELFSALSIKRKGLEGKEGERFSTSKEQVKAGLRASIQNLEEKFEDLSKIFTSHLLENPIEFSMNALIQKLKAVNYAKGRITKIFEEKKSDVQRTSADNKRLRSAIDIEKNHIILKLKAFEGEVATALSGNIGERVSHRVEQLLESFQQQLAAGQRDSAGSPKKEETDGSTLSTAEP